ncbi:MAG: rhamnulokinase [Tannerella sp.]|jgi:rhamnulokinase|nr:rhamnulokinase [Tannerella sp.]
MAKHYFLAFDLGATSGRSILGSLQGDDFEMRELTRFPNAVMQLHGRYYWDIAGLYKSLKEGLKECARQGIRPTSIGIDTWGVDFGYIGADGSILGFPRAYRDPYTDGMADKYFAQVMPREKVYSLTGIQVMNFNSLFQLYAADNENYAPFKAASEILFMPDLLAYMLTGKKICEYTEASTSQILNPVTRRFETSLLSAAGLKPSLLCPLVEPGTVIGSLTDYLAEETGIGHVPVVAVAGHDTASAVLAVPASDRNFAYLSSGTWSLLGVETDKPILTKEAFNNNFTNEGGVEGTTRFLKNITGMWLLEQCRKEWAKEGREYNYTQIMEMAVAAEGFKSTVNPDDLRFINPASMTAMLAHVCEENGMKPPTTDSEYVRCIFESLVGRYVEMMTMLSGMVDFPLNKLHIIGGGSQNTLINQMTAKALGIPVIAGPSEATAAGNCLMQACAASLVRDRWEIRQIVAKAFKVKTYS